MCITGRPSARQAAQQLAIGLDHPAQLRHVVAEHFAEAARLEEIALHVDEQQRAATRIEDERIRIRRDGQARRISRGASLARRGDGWRGRRHFLRFLSPALAWFVPITSGTAEAASDANPADCPAMNANVVQGFDVVRVARQRSAVATAALRNTCEPAMWHPDVTLAANRRAPVSAPVGKRLASRPCTVIRDRRETTITAAAFAPALRRAPQLGQDAQAEVGDRRIR